MKTYLLFIFFLFSSMILHAQESFEGKIVYKTNVRGTEQKDVSLEVFLKGSKMLFISNNKHNKAISFHCLYDFQKGISYAFYFDDSIVFTSSLEKKLVLKKTKNESDTDYIFKIKDYAAKKISYIVDSPKNVPLKNIEAWFSEELIFKVPDSVQSTDPPLLIFNGNSICLKMRSVMQGISENGPNSVLIYASAITKTELSDSIFEIPPYFKIMDKEANGNELLRKFREADSALQKITSPQSDEETMRKAKEMEAELKKEASPPGKSARNKKN